MHERIRDALLARWGGLVARRPWWTLLVCLTIAALSLVLALRNLEFRPDRSDLVAADLPWNHRYAAYKQQFPRWGDVIVVIEGDAGDRRVDALAKEVASTIAADQRVIAADAGFDASEAGPRLYKTASPPVFERTLSDLREARRVAAAENANAALNVLLAGLAAEQGDISSLDRLEAFLEPYLASAEGGAPDFGFLLPSRSRWQPFVSESGSGRLRYLRVHFRRSAAGVNDIGDHVAWLRGRLTELVPAAGVAGVSFGVTGIRAIEADETAQSMEDSMRASILAGILITALMVVNFRGVIVPLLAMVSLLIGMAWSFGWLVLAVGHLQVLSVMFTVILLGLGIDYALLYVSRLELVQGEHTELWRATRQVFRGVGPGVLTGAATTAAAFASTTFTDFTGMSEMGVISAGGILLCVAAVLSSFPALLAVTGRWKRIVRHRPGGETAHFARGWLDGVDAHPWRTLAISGVVVAAMLWCARGVRYDPNILKLQSAGVESVRWEHRIVADDSRSAWSALVVTTAAEAPALTERLRAQEQVSGVGGMGFLYPADAAERERRIAALVEAAPDAPLGDPGMTTLLEQLASVQGGLALRTSRVTGEAGTRLRALVRRVVQAQAELRRLDADEQRAAWAKLDGAFVHARGALRGWLEAALAPGPPMPAELPRALRDQWIGRDDSWLLLAHPAHQPEGRSILDPDRLEGFVRAVRSVAGDAALGPPVQIHESSRVIVRAYTLAACYAVGVILLLLLLDFRSLADATSCIAPVMLGFVGAFGVIGLADLSLNFANLIVMPLIFGIGVDASVNMVHRWRQEPHGRPAGLSGGTGRGITLAMLTTLIGFGCLIMAEHRGIRSLGIVMLVALSVTLVACYTVLPAILRLRAVPPTPAKAPTVSEVKGEAG
jgi:hypothetical protein